MTNYMDKNLQVPNYSGVNIQIFNPAVNMPSQTDSNIIPQGQITQAANHQDYSNPSQMASNLNGQEQTNQTIAPSPWATIPQNSLFTNNNQVNNNIQYPQQPINYTPIPYSYPYYQAIPPQQEPIKNFTDNNKMNTQTEKKKIVVLTDDYIRSLENYLNNPNREIRLHAARDIVNRFEEDSSRFDDPALNALLNKMIQDPQGSIRGIALSLITTGAAQGNNYTIELLNTMKQNPNNKEDALQAAEALLRMATKTETIDVPIKQTAPIGGNDGNNA